MKDKTQNITYLVVLLFIACYFARVFNMPNEMVVILGGAICAVLVMQQRKIRIDLGLCFLLITLASYYVISNGFRGMFYAILYIPLVIYLIAKYTIHGMKDSKEFDKKYFFLVVALVLGFAIHGLLNSYMYFAGYVVPGTRRWQDFWSGEIVPGTQHAAYFLPALAMFIPAVMYFKKRKILNTIFIALTIFFCYTALVTKSRMQLVIFVLVCAVQCLFFGILEKEKVKKLLSRKITWFVLMGLVIAFAIGFIAVKDTSVVAAFINNMGKGGGILNNVRFEAQQMALAQLFEFPMGGRQMELGRIYCHNTWLDMANLSGVIPFFAFAAYTLYTVFYMTKFLIKKNETAEMKIIILGLYLAFFLYMTVESVFDASIHFVTPWIFINGIVRSKC